MVAQQPSKLFAWVRLPSPALAGSRYPDSGKYLTAEMLDADVVGLGGVRVGRVDRVGVVAVVDSHLVIDTP